MAATRSVTPGASTYHDANNYEIWDPLNWMLDGLVDLPSFSIPGVQELEAHGGLSWRYILTILENFGKA